MPGNRTI